ncbi:hypothetical protein JIN85_15230 [Luteolibacter pohnpeiensis]|uniref:Uncharacterized protein n=2 Tax=Luteolibacter pohnpeiensis TaxID=454153 RepID=A0A934S9D4_9BACT|nr:hypothetical protein [Luteolibacter pohnpeiensis]
MSLKIPKRTWLTLREVGMHWKVDDIEVRHWLSSGYLTAHVWLPVMSVIERNKTNRQTESVRMHHWEGYTELSKEHCHRLFRMGTIRLREFHDTYNNLNYILPDSADDIAVMPDDLMILERDRLKFEQALSGSINSNRNLQLITDKIAHNSTFTPSFRSIHLEGKQYHFGSMQAKALEILYQAGKDNHPWCNGKQLLAEVGSQSYTLSNLFKRKPIWRKLIQSNKRGFYRLRNAISEDTFHNTSII